MAPAQITFRPLTLHHINLKTSHLNEMIKWYSLVVGIMRRRLPYAAKALSAAKWKTNQGKRHRGLQTAKLRKNGRAMIDLDCFNNWAWLRHLEAINQRRLLWPFGKVRFCTVVER